MNAVVTRDENIPVQQASEESTLLSIISHAASNPAGPAPTIITSQRFTRRFFRSVVEIAGVLKGKRVFAGVFQNIRDASHRLPLWASKRKVDLEAASSVQ